MLSRRQLLASAALAPATAALAAVPGPVVDFIAGIDVTEAGAGIGDVSGLMPRFARALFFGDLNGLSFDEVTDVMTIMRATGLPFTFWCDPRGGTVGGRV